MRRGNPHQNDTVWQSRTSGPSGGYLSCFGKKDTKEADWGGFELIAPAIKATAPDPTRHAISLVPVYRLRFKKDIYLVRISAILATWKRKTFYDYFPEENTIIVNYPLSISRVSEINWNL